MPLFRVDFQGTIHGIEVFQHGHHVSSSDSSAGVASDAATAWLALLADPNFAGNFSTGIVWSQVNVSQLGATPSDPIVTSAQAAISDAGTSAVGSCPPQCSVGVSLRTATAGSRARGRMYLPPPDTAAIGSNGRLTSGAAGELADSLETYFDSWAGNAADVVVVSGVGGVYTTYTVITLGIGDVIDTQRSRRNSIGEVYATRTVG